MSTKALRYNEGKTDWTLIDWESMEPLAKVMMYGAKKYAPDNWKGEVNPIQHIQCAFRHLIAIVSGEEIDPESGERHSGHVMANMMMYNFHTKTKEDYRTEDSNNKFIPILNQIMQPISTSRKLDECLIDFREIIVGDKILVEIPADYAEGNKPFWIEMEKADAKGFVWRGCPELEIVTEIPKYYYLNIKYIK